MTSDWVIVTEGQRPIQDIADDVTRSGLTVTSVLKTLGLLLATGEAETAYNVAALVKGVQSVERQQTAYTQ